MIIHTHTAALISHLHLTFPPCLTVRSSRQTSRVQGQWRMETPVWFSGSPCTRLAMASPQQSWFHQGRMVPQFPSGGPAEKRSYDQDLLIRSCYRFNLAQCFNSTLSWVSIWTIFQGALLRFQARHMSTGAFSELPLISYTKGQADLETMIFIRLK